MRIAAQIQTSQTAPLPDNINHSFFLSDWPKRRLEPTQHYRRRKSLIQLHQNRVGAAMCGVDKREGAGPNVIQPFSRGVYYGGPLFTSAERQPLSSQRQRKVEWTALITIVLSEHHQMFLRRLILSQIKTTIPAHLDQHRYALEANCSTEDVAITALCTGSETPPPAY